VIMSLTSRLSAFALAGLAVVLIGFSAVVFLLVQRHLTHQIDARLETAMHTLVAAIEVHPADVEWEPLERHIALGDDPGEDQIRWLVHDAEGRLVDCSANLVSASHSPDLDAPRWRLCIRQVRAGRFEAEEIPVPSEPVRGQPPDWAPGHRPLDPTGLPEDRTCQSQAFLLTAAVRWDPVAASLWQLAWTLLAVSAGIWLTAALLGRWLCRRVLRPVTQMASSARSLRAADPAQRLAVSPTGDELEDLGKAFNEVLARLHASYERQERFAADAAHQLRTPLTAVLGQVEVALRQQRPADEYRRALEIVQRRSHQLRSIVEVLLFLARADTTSQVPALETIDLCEWLPAFLEEWSEDPRARDLCPPDVPPQSCCVRANAVLLGQLMSNLLENAAKYSDAGTPVVVQLQRGEDDATLTVEDRGFGISSEELPYVCDPFYRSPQARLRGCQGMGLGLAVVQQIVKVLGGRLIITSKLGQGSTFAVTLPLAKEGEEALGWRECCRPAVSQ
jgi:signal transduction histidine kinase